MTDSEIIKAVECCVRGKCEGCSCWVAETDSCWYYGEDKTFDLIRKLQTKIDNLIKTYKECMAANLREFVERLYEIVHIMSEMIREHIGEKDVSK